MITVLQRGVLEHNYSVPRILGYYVSNIISMDLTIYCQGQGGNRKSVFVGVPIEY